MSYVNVGVKGLKTKKALKEAVKADPSKVYVFGTGGFVGPTYDGIVSSMPANVKLSVCGPDPYNDRRWWATIERKADGTIKVS